MSCCSLLKYSSEHIHPHSGRCRRESSGEGSASKLWECGEGSDSCTATFLGEKLRSGALSCAQEYYGDYQAVDPYHFTVNASNNYAAYLPLSSESPAVQQLCERSVEAITAVFLSLKKRPLIRYQKSSEISRRIAQDAGVGPSGLKDGKVMVG